MTRGLVIIAALLAAWLCLYLLREPLHDFANAWMTRNMFVSSDRDNFDPGPALNSRFPGLRASYQERTITLINEFAGDNGTVLVVIRSLDWSPYCRRQMVQLQQSRAGFEAAGIALVAISSDPPAILQAFSDQFGITIPLLSDNAGLSFKTLGILDQRHQDKGRATAYPGMIVISPTGAVVGKLFLEDQDTRVDSSAALVFAKARLGLD